MFFFGTEKGDGPERSKRGTVLEERKGGRSLKAQKGDGPGRTKKGTVLESAKKGRSLEKQK